MDDLQSHQMQPQAGAKNRLIAIVVAAVLLILIALGGLWWYLRLEAAKQASQYSHLNTVNSVLRDTNDPFAQAEALSGASSTEVQAQRVALYQQALTQATDNIQRGHILYKLATATLKSGDYLGAVNLFESIGTTTTYSKYDRAYAIQSLGSIFYEYHDRQITRAIFTNAPYSRLYVSTSTARSYLHLYEYAASIYPLGLSEARIADAYSSGLKPLLNATSTQAVALRNQYISMINDALGKVDADVARVKDDPNAKYDIPGILLRKAVVLGKLAIYHIRTPQEAEDTFQQSWNTQETLYHYPDPYFFFHYADYLAAMYGKSRSADIQSELSHLDDGSYDVNSPVVSFLKNEEGNVTGTKPDIQLLASIDPKFKAYLETIGWSASDFK